MPAGKETNIHRIRTTSAAWSNRGRGGPVLNRPSLSPARAHARVLPEVRGVVPEPQEGRLPRAQLEEVERALVLRPAHPILGNGGADEGRREDPQGRLVRDGEHGSSGLLVQRADLLDRGEGARRHLGCRLAPGRAGTGRGPQETPVWR